MTLTLKVYDGVFAHKDIIEGGKDHKDITSLLRIGKTLKIGEDTFEDLDEVSISLTISLFYCLCLYCLWFHAYQAFTCLLLTFVWEIFFAIFTGVDLQRFFCLFNMIQNRIKTKYVIVLNDTDCLYNYVLCVGTI